MRNKSETLAVFRAVRPCAFTLTTSTCAAVRVSRCSNMHDVMMHVVAAGLYVHMMHACVNVKAFRIGYKQCYVFGAKR